MASIYPQPKMQFFTNDGDPAVGYKLYTYEPGSAFSVLKDTYSDDAGTPNTNPIIMDARGEATVFWDGQYDVKLETDTGSLVWTQINVGPARLDLDGALVTDDGTQITLASAIALRAVQYASIEALRLSTTSHDYVETSAFYDGGSTGGAPLYRDGTGTPTGPGADVAAAALAAGTFCNAAGHCYKLKPDQLITDSMFGATYDNSTDDTACINSCLTFVTGKTVCLGIAGETAKCNSLSVGNGTTVYFISAKYVRNGAANNPLITFGTDCLIYGEVELDGVKGTYTGSSNHGLRVGDNCVSLAKIISHDNYKHGVQYNGDNIHLLGTVTAYDNGTTPGGSGTGDGVYAVNSDNSSLKNYYCYDNARNGVSVTTYDGASLDPTLSVNFILSDGRATGNGYTDIDVEGVTRPRLHNVTDCGTISLNQSVEGDIENITCAIFSATSHDRIRVADVSLRPTGTVSNVFAVTGDSPNIDNVYMYDTATSYGTSSTILIDASVASGFDGLANVRNVVTENGYNAIVVSGCQVLQGCAAITATNRSLQVDSRRIAGTVAKQLATEIRGGVMHSQSALTGDPTANGYTGTFYQGDRVYRTDAVEAGAVSSKYVIEGYIYTTGWLQMRTLTGN